MYRRYYNRYEKIVPKFAQTNTDKIQPSTNSAEHNTYRENQKYKVQSYDDPEIIVPEKSGPEAALASAPPRPYPPVAPIGTDGLAGIKRIFGKLDIDDIIILGLIILLLLEDCDDYLLIGVLAYLFISGWQN